MDWALVLAVFFASAVEAVEALTIVLAVGFTRGWRVALRGAVIALAILVVIVAVLGTAIVHYVPLAVLRTVVGLVLLIFGLQWLRKAVLRSTGLKALHDEAAIFESQVALLKTQADRQGFLIAFKGVLLEGLEVAVIVISLGSSAHALGQASLAALAAVVVVAACGLVISRALTEVPENKLKMVVGIMLTSFGTFWMAEGLGLRWPGGTVFLIPTVIWFALTVLVLVVLGKRRASAAR
ncbi:COG4280 domain-containing protein [Ferrimicrobium acidiphilum]|uniref:GDT1 family protein n=1 Tax=Ferrimicrobium acidiphilum DSM 19497 TaxID=1121877 RepID=A0A0D8FRJ1_9ACTN|nr:TMEM165/GDT1 family protein [Ferrimicrobium acidiphilum]KJE75736.1 hypothetical protein FEAC_25130 [Ferrimicrobium acidiphilum DSM 19497]MCL5052299.1 TMEM165/GDT1 family protein [Gammaproteobacteria bacterium]